MADAREIADHVIVRWNDHDKPNWVDTFTDSARLTAPGFEASGSDAVRGAYALWQDAFPDCHVRIRATYVDGDTAVQDGVFEGTHTGAFTAPGQAPIEATDNKVSLSFVSILTMRNGKIDGWALYLDRVELLAQLGAIG